MFSTTISYGESTGLTNLMGSEKKNFFIQPSVLGTEKQQHYPTNVFAPH